MYIKSIINNFLLASTLTVSVLSLSFGSVQALAVQGSQDSFKVRIQQKIYNYNTNTRKWELDNNSSTNTYQEKVCKDLYSQKILGIADHQDGISLNVKRLIEKGDYSKTKSEEYYSFLPGGIARADKNLRECTKYNLLAGNAHQALYQDAEVGFPKHSKDVDSFYYRPTGALPPQEELDSFIPANLPVYVYQYQFNYKFPESQKSQLSDLYRKQTGAEEGKVYDGIIWTYTYYTYLDKQTGRYKPWTNPNLDNENGGFLIYHQPV